MDELGLFIEEKPVFTKKKFRRSAVCRDFMTVQVTDFSFWITEGIGLTRVSFHFCPQEQIPSGSSHTNFWLLFHFHVKHLPIFMF
jgi:hypothetical protein